MIKNKFKKPFPITAEIIQLRQDHLTFYHRLFANCFISAMGKNPWGLCDTLQAAAQAVSTLSQTKQCGCYRESGSLVARAISIGSGPCPGQTAPCAKGARSVSLPSYRQLPLTQNMTLLNQSCSNVSGICLLLLLCK